MIEEINGFMSEACGDLDLTMMKIDTVMEAAKRQLSINYKSAELKVMQECGTSEDLAYLYEEAEAGLIETVARAIDKIIEAIKKFFADMRDKVLTIITSKENKETLKKIEKKVKLFPLIGRKKIIIEDIKSQNKVIEEHQSKLMKLKAKAKSGQEVTEDDVAEVEKSFMEKYGKIIGVGAAITITVSSAIALLDERIAEVAADLKKIEADSIDFMTDAKRADRIGASLSRAYSSIAKAKSKHAVDSCSMILSKIKEALKGAKNVAVDNKAVLSALKESEDSIDSVETEMPEESDMQTEDSDGEDDIPAVDDEPDTDPWDDVMGSDDDECNGDDCETPDDSDEDDEDDSELDNFDDILERFNESVSIDDLDFMLDSILSEAASDDVVEESSVADKLFADIENLF